MKSKFKQITLESTLDFLFSALLIALLILLYKYNYLLYWSQNTDSAGFVGLIQSIRDGHGMVSPVFTSFFSYIPYLAVQPEIVCTSNFQSLYQDTSYLRWHPYLMAYPLAWISSVLHVSSLEISSLVNALNVVGSFSIIYYYLREKKLNPVIAALFVIILISFSALSGYISGQFYFDRLMLFPCVTMILVLLDQEFLSKYKLLIIGPSFLVCLLISERSALIASIILILYSLISLILRRRVKVRNYIILGFLGLIYNYVYMHFYLNNEYYVAMSFSSAFSNVLVLFDSNRNMGLLTLKWLLVLTPLLFLCFFSFSFFWIVLICLLPNVLVTIGGGEKVGFLTHYHAVYLPALIAISAIGYVQISKKIKKYTYVLASVIIIYNFTLNINYTDNIIFNTQANVKNTKIAKFLDYEKFLESVSRFRDILPNSTFAKQSELIKIQKINLLSNIPSSAKISLPEGMMPAVVMHGNRGIDYFPIGIYDNDYVIVQPSSISDYFSVTSYLGHAVNSKIEKCISEIIERDFVKVPVPRSEYSGPYQIYKRVRRD